MSEEEVQKMGEWHLNKSVPVTLILAIIAQTVALIWFVATLRSDVDINQTQLLRHEVRIETIEDIVQNQAVMLARIDENLKAIRDAIERNQNINR